RLPLLFGSFTQPILPGRIDALTISAPRSRNAERHRPRTVYFSKLMTLAPGRFHGLSTASHNTFRAQSNENSHPRWQRTDGHTARSSLSGAQSPGGDPEPKSGKRRGARSAVGRSPPGRLDR